MAWVPELRIQGLKIGSAGARKAVVGKDHGRRNHHAALDSNARTNIDERVNLYAIADMNPVSDIRLAADDAVVSDSR